MLTHRIKYRRRVFIQIFLFGGWAKLVLAAEQMTAPSPVQVPVDDPLTYLAT
jgi:hypothetical protein